MSKKLAAGADAILLDVKFGRGAFMPDARRAAELAADMVAIGEAAGRRTVALVTAMDDPLGRCVGNAIEVEEAIQVLRGDGDPGLTEACLAIAGEMCVLADVEAEPARAIRSGAALARLWEMLEAQGGSRERPARSHPTALTVAAEAAGWVGAIDALRCGLAVIDLGGGRLRKEDRVDHGVGLELAAMVGDRVEVGDPLVHVHAPDEDVARRAVPRLDGAWRIVSHQVARPPHLRYRVDRLGTHAPDTLSGQ
jgi:thymidine phosphorylase